MRRENFSTPDAAGINEEIERLEGLFKHGSGIRPFELKAAVQTVMWDKLGPVRDGSGIEAAISTLKQIEKEQIKGMVIGCDDRVYNRDRMEAIELPLMIKTHLVAHSALRRSVAITIQNRFSRTK
jgi:succinate dehydrogenase/fumarate reductase flavoprotein subunit